MNEWLDHWINKQPGTCPKLAGLNQADLRVQRRCPASRQPTCVLHLSAGPSYTRAPHVVLTHQPANGTKRERIPVLGFLRVICSKPFYCEFLTRLGVERREKVMNGPETGETQIPDFVLISGRRRQLRESAAGTLSPDELRNSRMSLDKCLLDKWMGASVAYYLLSE